MGALLADGFIGLYKTILCLSIIYFLGEATLALTSISDIGQKSVIGPAIGLLVIAVGTGGIRSCVGAFGGTQFDQERQKRQLFFFYIFLY